MALYRVLYLKDEAAVERFRSQAPPSGPASLKPKDYALVAEIEAPHEYAAWGLLQGDGALQRHLRPMGVGDVLEAEPGRPRVCRFAGFDDATWFTFEPKPKAAGADEVSATPPEVPAETILEAPTADSPPAPAPSPAEEPGPAAARRKK